MQKVILLVKETVYYTALTVIGLGDHSLTANASMSQSLVTNMIGQRLSEGSQISEAPVPSSWQSNQQVTGLNSLLSDVLYVSRPISSRGTATGSKSATENQACAPSRRKAPPVDPFTAQDAKITFDDLE